MGRFCHLWILILLPLSRLHLHCFRIHLALVAVLDSLEDLLDICFWWLILTFKQLLALVFKSVFP